MKNHQKIAILRFKKKIHILVTIKTKGRVKYIISEQIFQNRRESTDILEEESVYAGDISEQVFDRGKSIFVVKYSFSF